MENYDTDGDGDLSSDELGQITTLRLADMDELVSLSGLCHLSSLQELSIVNCNKIEEIYISESDNLSNVAIEQCGNLKEVEITYNEKLTSVHITSCSILENIELTI